MPRYATTSSRKVRPYKDLKPKYRAKYGAKIQGILRLWTGPEVSLSCLASNASENKQRGRGRRERQQNYTKQRTQKYRSAIPKEVCGNGKDGPVHRRENGGAAYRTEKEKRTARVARVVRVEQRAMTRATPG
ncbi:hypothetical protein THAOC_22438 [Thalassiosira oceanica]|uniref:Uncharacterized protein n=1 Tax=Thalassiosira oceanica TaxID=159749 RepID=K0RYF1_THAOC|nr:hypothetical protein THAOC_22438 [Thalassiosira oceanica]|eukprot:EJK57509.1 hypothetical protein THAOC_22438 [Thalassiosira oceanica]